MMLIISSCQRRHPACTEGHVELRPMTSTVAVIKKRKSDIINTDAYISVSLQMP